MSILIFLFSGIFANGFLYVCSEKKIQDNSGISFNLSPIKKQIALKNLKKKQLIKKTEELVKQKEILLSRIDAINKEKEELEKINKFLKQERDTILQKNNEYESLVANYSSKLKDLEEAVKNKEKEITEVNGQKDRAISREEEVQRNITDLKLQLQSEQEKCAEIEKQMDCLGKEIEKLNSFNLNFTEHQATTMTSLRTSNYSRNKSSTSSSTGQEDSLKDLQDKRKTDKETILGLQTKLQNVNTELENLKADCETYLTQFEKITQENNKIKSESEGIKVNYDRVLNQLQHLKHQQGTLNFALKEAKNQIENLKTQLNSKDMEIKTLAIPFKSNNFDLPSLAQSEYSNVDGLSQVYFSNNDNESPNIYNQSDYESNNKSNFSSNNQLRQSDYIPQTQKRTLPTIIETNIMDETSFVDDNQKRNTKNQFDERTGFKTKLAHTNKSVHEKILTRRSNSTEQKKTSFFNGMKIDNNVVIPSQKLMIKSKKKIIEELKQQLSEQGQQYHNQVENLQAELLEKVKQIEQKDKNLQLLQIEIDKMQKEHTKQIKKELDQLEKANTANLQELEDKLKTKDQSQIEKKINLHSMIVLEQKNKDYEQQHQKQKIEELSGQNLFLASNLQEEKVSKKNSLDKLMEKHKTEIKQISKKFQNKRNTLYCTIVGLTLIIISIGIGTAWFIIRKIYGIAEQDNEEQKQEQEEIIVNI